MSTTPRDMPPDLKLRVLDAARREASPARAAVVRQGVLLGVAAALGLGGVFFAIGGVHADQRPMAHVAGTAVGWAIVALVATWQGFGRGRSMLGRPGGRMVLVVAATPVLLLGWVLAWNAQYPEAVVPCPLAHCLNCLVLTLAMAAAPFAALTLARRGSDPVHPRATGAALGAAAGAWGAVMIDLRCSYLTVTHVALGHALPVVMLAAVGAWVGARVLAVK
jgi:hypothetical protein